MTARVPVDIVQALRKTGLDAKTLSEDFQLKVNYDGRDRLAFTGAPDIVTLAISTLEIRVGKSEVPKEGLQTTLVQSVVLWTVYGETGVVLYNILQDELHSLKVKYKVDVTTEHNPDKTIKYVEISGKQKDYKAINTILLDLIKTCENIILSKSSIKVKLKQNSKKVNGFIKSIDADTTVYCVFHDSKDARSRRVEIYGKNKEAVTQTEKALEQEIEGRYDSTISQVTNEKEKNIEITAPTMRTTEKLKHANVTVSTKNKHAESAEPDKKDATVTSDHSSDGSSKRAGLVRKSELADKKQLRTPDNTLNKGFTSQCEVLVHDPPTSSDCKDSIFTIARRRNINDEIRASSQDDDIVGSDMCESIKRNNNDHGTYDSSDEDDVHNDTFAIVLRCKKRRGGYARSVQTTQSRDEALKWRYIFKNDTRLQGFKTNIGSACHLIDICIDSNVADIECENVRSSIVEEKVKSCIGEYTSDLRVKVFDIAIEESRKIVEVLDTTRTDFSNRTVAVFLESRVCYLVCPAHVFQKSIDALQKTRDYISAMSAN